MALTLNNIIGPLLGDLTEFDVGTNGPPTVTATGAPRAGSYILVVNAGQRARASLYPHVARADANHVFGFRFKTDDITPTTDSQF